MNLDECFLEMMCHSRWVFNYCLTRLPAYIYDTYSTDLDQLSEALDNINHKPYSDVEDITNIPPSLTHALTCGFSYLILGEEIIGSTANSNSNNNTSATLHSFLGQTKVHRNQKYHNCDNNTTSANDMNCDARRTAKQAQGMAVRWFSNEGIVHMDELLEVIFGPETLMSSFDSDYDAFMCVAEHLSSTEPFYLGAHVMMLRGLLLRYCSTIVTPRDIISHVMKVNPMASAELYTLEDTLLFWLRSVLELSPSEVFKELGSNLSDLYLNTNDGRLISLILYYYQPNVLPLRCIELGGPANNNDNNGDNNLSQHLLTVSQRQKNWANIIAAGESIGLWMGIFPEEMVTHGFSTLQLHLLRIVEELFAVLAVGVENSYAELLNNMGYTADKKINNNNNVNISANSPQSLDYSVSQHQSFTFISDPPKSDDSHSNTACGMSLEESAVRIPSRQSNDGGSIIKNTLHLSQQSPPQLSIRGADGNLQRSTMPNVSILSSSSTQLDSHTAFILSKSANISIDVRPSSAGGVTSNVGGQSEVGEFAAKVSNIISSSPREIVDTHSKNNNINKSRDCNAAPQLTNIDIIGDKSGAQGMYNIVLTNMFLQGTKIPIHAHQQLPSDRESCNNNKRGMDLDRHASMNGKDDHRQGDPVSPLPTIDLSDVPDTDTTVRLATTNRTPVSHPRSIQSSPSLAPVASLTDDSGMGPLTIDRSASPKVSGKKYRSYAHSGDVEEICTGSAGRSVNSIRVDTRLNHSETQDISAYIRRSRNRNMVNNNTGESQTEGQRHDVIPTKSQENLRPEKAKLCNEEVYQKDRIISTSSSELLLPLDQVIRCDSPIRATAPRKKMSPLSALDETTNPITSVVPVAVDSCGKRADNPLMKSLCVLRSRQQCEGGSLHSGNADGSTNIPGRPYYATTTVQGSLDRDGIINMIKELRQAVSNNNNITNNNTCEINTHSSKQGLADENQRLREALERQQALITSFLSKMATMVDSRATDSDGTAIGVTLQQSLKDMGMAGGITSLSLPTGEVGLGDTIPGSGCTPSLQGESLPLSRTSFVGSMKNGVLSKSVGNNLCDISNNNINIVNNTAREMELISKLPNVMPSGVICDDVTMKEGMCVIRSEGSLTDNRSDNSNHTNNNNIYDNQQGDANKFNTQEATHISISPDVSHRPAPVVFDVSIDCLRGLDKTCRDKNSNNKNNNMTRRQPQSTDDVTNIITIHTGDSLPRNTHPIKSLMVKKTTKNGIVIDINKVSLQQQDDEKKREDRVMKQEPHHHQRQRTSSLLSRGNNYQHVCWNNKPTVTLALRYALLPGRVNQRMLDSVLEVMGRYETDQQDTSTPTPIVQSDSTEAQNRGTTATNIPIHPQQLQQWYMILLKEEGTFVFRGLYVASKRMVPCAVENIISTDNNNNNNNNPPMMAITTLKRIFGAGPVGLSVCAQQSSNGGSAYTDKPYQQEGYPIASSPRYYKYNTCTKQFEEQQSSEVGSTTDAMTIGKMQRLNWQKILY